MQIYLHFPHLLFQAELLAERGSEEVDSEEEVEEEEEEDEGEDIDAILAEEFEVSLLTHCVHI